MKTIEELFSDLRKKRQEEFNGIQNSFALDGIWDNVVEKYSEKAHFIYEVLQNADDVGATWAKFELYQDCLVFRHNGTIHFNITPSNSEKEDYKQGRLGSLNAITATSKSTKTENSIGKFGVGFKAVFRYTKTPRIYDKDIWFAIHDYIVPERLSEDFPGRNEETVFVFPFDREPSADAVYVVPDTATCYAEIKNRLEKLKMPTLFLSTLSKVEFVCKTGSSQDGPSCGDDSSGEYSIDEDIISRKTFNADETRPRTTVKILHNKKILNGGEKFNDNLVMFSRGAAPSKKCCLCFKLDADGKIAPLNGFDAFCFFPTQHHTGLPFLVHAPFQLNDAREMLCEDSEHNRTLVDDLRNLFADSFVYLERIWKITNHRYYDDGLLDLLPLHRNETQPVKEFESFFINESANPAILKPDHPILRAFQTESVLPTGDGYTAKAHANFAETAWIIDAFPTTALRILLDDENADWAFPSTRKDKSGSADKGKSSFVEQTVCRTVDSTFIRKRLSEEIIRNCYNRLGENWLWRLHGTINDVKENVEEKKKFCQCPIFLNSNNNVCSALNADGHNILFLPSETTGEPVSGFMTVLPSSVKDTSSPTAKLLKTCNATCPTKRDAVLSEVRYLLETELEEPDHLLAFQVIVADLGDLSSKDRATVISELKRCKFYGKKSNNDVCLLESSEIYFREDNLVRYFSACSEVGFLDLDKYKQALGEQHADEVESLFLELGVERLPRKKDITYTSTDKFDQEYKSRDWKKNEQSYKTEEWIEEEFDGMLAAINFLDKVQLNNGVKETCIAVWQVLVKLVHKYGENGFLNEGKHHYYRKGKWYNDTEPAPSYLLHRLRTAKWLLSKYGQQLVSAQETNVQSVLDVYAGNTPQEVALRRIIGLKDNAETRLMSELMKLNPKWASALDQIIKRDKETVGDVGTGRDATVETGRAVNQDEGLDPAEVEIDRHQWPLGTGPDVRGPFDRIPQGTVSWVSEVEPFIKGDVTIAGTQIRRAKLRIPPYQRRFAWKEHDVRLLCRDLLKTNGAGHYHLGTIILHRNEAGVEEIWDVVDGQQRLTNIMAILKAPVFDSNLTENGTIRIKKFSRRDYEMVKSVLEEYGESDKETIKNRLKSCTLAFVAVKDIAEAFQLFGTQNGRGKPLTPVNLLKAYHYREMNADFEQWKKERKNKVTGDTTEEQFKKDFDREVRFNIEKSWESANGEDASTASCDGKLLSHVFGEYLFRIRNWNHGKFPTESFGNRDIGEFKGVTIRPKEDQNWQLPLQNCAVLRKEVKTTEDSFIARRGREPAGFMPFMSICQTIVNGEDFFHYAETYATAYKHVFKENTVPEFSEFYTTNCSPSQHNKGGAMYARHIFEALCLFCYDLFGGEGLKACYQALFCCAYFERVSQARVLYRKCGATFAPRAIEVMSRNFTIEDVRQGLNDLASEAKTEIRKSGYLENLDQSQLTAGQKMQKAACKIIFG